MSNVAAGKDIDDNGESLNDVETALNKQGIALRSAKGEWKNFEDVIDEVAEKWNNGTFNSIQQSQIATAIAGVRQQENFRAMMNNWDEVQRLTGVAAESTGSATERMGIYLESVEAKTNNLKAAWENFVMSLNQSDSYKQLLDWLTQFLEKLEFVDWKSVGVIAGIGGIITIILKLIPAIKTLIGVIKEAGLAAGIASGGIVPLLGLVVTGVLAIATAWKSANDNAEQQIHSIQKQREELETEKSTVQDLYKQYSELEGKSKYYSLTAEEKQKLVDVSKELVEKYGLETSGVDGLTGSYNLANNALEKYLDNLQKQKDILNSEEEKAYKEKAKDSLKDIDNKKKEASNFEDNYGESLLNGSEEERKDIIRLFKKVGVYEGKKQRNRAGVLSKEDRDAYNDVKNQLKQYGYEDSDFNANDQTSTYNNIFKKFQKSKVKLTGLDMTDDEVENVYNTMFSDIISNYNKAKTEITSETKELSESISALLKSKLGTDVPNEISNMVENSLKTAFSIDGFVDNIKNTEDFIDDYTSNFINTINANDGKNIEKILNRYEELQTKVNNGTLTSGEYKEYQEVLRVYVGLQEEALKATGMTQAEVEKFLQTLSKKSTNNLNVELLEMQENMRNSTEYTDAQKTSFANFSNSIISLNGKFKEGKISGEEYFKQLNNITNGIDPSNIQQITDTFGDLNNYLTSMTSILSDSTNYIQSIWTTFQGGGDSLDFLKDFLPAAQQVQSMADNFLKIEKASYSIDLNTGVDQREKLKSTSAEDLQSGIKEKYNVEVNTEEVERAKSLLEQIGNMKWRAYVETEGLDEIDEGFTNTLDMVDNLTDGTADLTSNVAELGDALGDLAELDFGGIDKAFETVSAAFDELPKNVSSLVGTANQEVQSSARQMAQWMVNIANSDEDYAKTAQQNILNTMGTTNDAQWAMSQENVDALANAYMADAQNTANFASDANSIAQQAMSTAVKKLGQVLSQMGSAIANLDVEIPLSLDGLDDNVSVAGIPIPVHIPTIKTVFKIGGTGTKGLSGIGDALKGFGDTLQSDAVANTIASNFTPVQANYTPNNVGSKKGSPTGSHSPSGGGSGKKGSGSDYSPDDAASDLKDILQDIEKYEEDIELDLEDQTEQFINQEMLAANRLDTLKEELDYFNDIYDVTENTTKWLETQNKILENQSKKVGALQNATASIEAQRKKLIDQNSGYNVASWFDSEGNDTLAYGDFINSFAYRIEAIQRETASKMRNEYNSVSGSTSKDAISAAKDRIKQIEEEGDIRIKELEKERDKVEKIHDSVGELNDAWRDNQEAIRDALAELHDVVISIRDELLEDITEQLEKAVDKMNTSIEKDVTRMEQLVTIQEAYNDLLNETIETQQELDSELQASLDSFEYLDEQMRQLMFNEDDYKVLSETLSGIQEDIAGIWEDHYKQIDELTDDTMYKAEYITNETERQLDMKMKEYELAKAELDVAKARTNLQNVQNERNVRMYVGGQWIWTADPNAVKDAQQQLADAEREKTKIEREAEQKRLLDKMNQIIDSDNLQIDENNELLERIQEAIEMQTQEVKSIEDALNNASGEDLPALNDVLQGAFGRDGGDFKTIMANLNKRQTELAAALQGHTTDSANKLLQSGTLTKSQFMDMIGKLGYGWNENGTVTTQDGSFRAHYQGWVDTTKINTPLGTGSNGASVTGGGAGSSGGNSGGGGGGGNGFPRSGSVKTNSLPLNIRSGAGTNYRVLGTMPKGASLTVTGESGGWAQIEYRGIKGWASKQYLAYDQGGLAKGKGVLLKDVNTPERVLSPQQTKSFDKLVDNLTVNPILSALTKNNIKGTSNFNRQNEKIGETKQYYFSNFTVEADNISEFISSLEGMIPISNK